jgi:hypothetical protein
VWKCRFSARKVRHRLAVVKAKMLDQSAYLERDTILRERQPYATTPTALGPIDHRSGLVHDTVLSLTV